MLLNVKGIFTVAKSQLIDKPCHSDVKTLTVRCQGDVALPCTVGSPI